jgi:hypothetical protein
MMIDRRSTVMNEHQPREFMARTQVFGFMAKEGLAAKGR